MATKKNQIKSTPKKIAVDSISKALEADAPHIYFNGFSVALGHGDVVIALEINRKPVAVLNASYTVAKTLSEKLNDMINTLENISGSNIMTVDDIKKFASESKGKKNVKTKKPN